MTEAEDCSFPSATTDGGLWRQTKDTRRCGGINENQRALNSYINPMVFGAWEVRE